MPIGVVTFKLDYDGKPVDRPLFRTISLDEATWHTQVLTCNQSNAAIAFGPVATAFALYMETAGSISWAFNSGNTERLSADGFLYIHRTSGNALTVTNDSATAETTIRVAILGT